MIKYKLMVNNNIKPIAWAHFAPIGDGYDIIDIYVHLSYRRKGFAKKMILDFIKRVKLKNIMLEVRNNNIAAIKLYKSLGFESVSKRKSYYKGSEDALVMRRVYDSCS